MLDISLKEKALSIGFDLYGVTKSIIPEKAQNDFKEFIKNKYYGSMSWFPERQDIRNNFLNLGLEPKSAICLGVIYNSINHKNIVKNIKISRYATGRDYHKILKGMGKEFINFLKIKFPSSKFRQGVDTLPISEKVLSENAGLGWIGKNTNLISKQVGSYFFLTVILTDQELTTDNKLNIDCGSCSKCIDACPTNALFEPYKINASLCISHTTIENREDTIPENLANNLQGWVYGCDICQEVCPWNIRAERKNIFSKISDFEPLDIFYSEEKLLSLSEKEFNHLTLESAISRITYKQWKRNISYYFKNEKEKSK